MKKLMRFLKNEEGATVVEYALIVALVSIAALLVWQVLGPQITQAFQAVSNAFTTAGYTGV